MTTFPRLRKQFSFLDFTRGGTNNCTYAYTVNIFFLPTGFRAVTFDTWRALYSTENYHDNVRNNRKSRMPRDPSKKRVQEQKITN